MEETTRMGRATIITSRWGSPYQSDGASNSYLHRELFQVDIGSI